MAADTAKNGSPPEVIGLTADFDARTGYLLVDAEGVLGKQHRGGQFRVEGVGKAAQRECLCPQPPLTLTLWQLTELSSSPQ
mmetsp:Transcript_49807/g.124302  ORF Transcript_49807/g.124302 Transcript_49807/m.124302 type:complete len:81 (-) Transcript_49807:85-327(-)